jgi:hypothetical protein
MSFVSRGFRGRRLDSSVDPSRLPPDCDLRSPDWGRGDVDESADQL